MRAVGCFQRGREGDGEGDGEGEWKGEGKGREMGPMYCKYPTFT